MSGSGSVRVSGYAYTCTHTKKGRTMYMLYRTYLSGMTGNLSRDGAPIEQMRIDADDPESVGKAIERVKRAFKETYGCNPYVDRMIVDANDPAEALLFEAEFSDGGRR